VADLCFITTCKGRLEHLKRSLPTRVDQPGTSSVVVDYDCPDGTAAWVATNHPGVHVVKVENRPFFNASEARNLGAAHEVARAAKWLCFIDADVLLNQDFSRVVTALLEPGFLFLANVDRFDATGMCICGREDFDAIGGYDTAFRGYGVEDEDLVMRLRMRGARVKRFPGTVLAAILRHDGAMRTAHHAQKDIDVSVTVNQAYSRAKWDLIRQKGEDMPLPVRQQLYQYVLDAFERHGASAQPLRLRVPLHKYETRSHGTMESALVYEFDRKPKPLP
jgi:GT2 family glycosyltransferase